MATGDHVTLELDGREVRFSNPDSGIHVDAHIEQRWGFTEVRRAVLALAREVERRMPAGKATSKWWKEERVSVFLDYNQNARDRTIASA